MAAVLSAYGSAIWIEHRAHQHLDIVITAVAMTITLARVQRGTDTRNRLIGTAVLTVSAAGASEISSLLQLHPVIGGAAFTAAMAGAIWIRRFGARAATAGAVMVVPFITLLLTQGQGTPPSNLDHDLWSALIALVSALWVALYQLSAAALGLPGQGPRPPTPQQRPRPRTASSSARRIPPSTRMACQMAVALGAACAVGHAAFHSHWPWAVLTAFIVGSGARSRGDVLHKGVLRAVGAAAGTVLATAIAGTFPPADRWSVVIIFVVLGMASWLREISYAFWAGSVTAVLSLLYGYFGQSATGLLTTRLEAILVGAALGIAASWFVLPIRTGDVLKRRMGEAHAALSAFLSAPTGDQAEIRRRQARFQQAATLLEQIAKPLRAQRRLTGRAARADAIDVMLSCVEPVRALAETGRYSVRSTSAADEREARTDGRNAPSAAIAAPETASAATVGQAHTCSSEAGRSRPVP